MKFIKKLKKSFTIVELIISLAIGSILIMMTYIVMSQSLGTIHETTVAGTMDNYAYSIQKRIRSELITAKYINLGSIRDDGNKIDKTLGNTAGYNYKNLYYANENELMYGIIFNEAERRVSVAFYPQYNQQLPSDKQEFREISVIFSEEGANGVKISDFIWNVDDYSANAQNYNNPDYNNNSARLVRYKFTLTKNYSSGKKPLVKTYYFTEVLECAF